MLNDLNKKTKTITLNIWNHLDMRIIKTLKIVKMYFLFRWLFWWAKLVDPPYWRSNTSCIDGYYYYSSLSSVRIETKLTVRVNVGHKNKEKFKKTISNSLHSKFSSSQFHRAILSKMIFLLPTTITDFFQTIFPQLLTEGAT